MMKKITSWRLLKQLGNIENLKRVEPIRSPAHPMEFGCTRVFPLWKQKEMRIILRLYKDSAIEGIANHWSWNRDSIPWLQSWVEDTVHDIQIQKMIESKDELNVWYYLIKAHSRTINLTLRFKRFTTSLFKNYLFIYSDFYTEYFFF